MQSKGVVLNQWLYNYEHHVGEVAKLKHQYLAKVRKADEAEDEYVTFCASMFLSVPLTYM